MVTPALTKDDRSPVTVADFAAQALVGHLLGEAFAGELLVGEERADQLRRPEGRGALEQVTRFVARAVPEATPETVCRWIDRGGAEPGERFWTLDPVDGTKGFLRGEQYVVALALVIEGRVELGVLGCPNLLEGATPELGGPGSLLVAARGQGTWAAPLAGGDYTRLSVSRRDNPAEARLLRSVESGHTDVGGVNQLVEALGVEAEPVLMDSQAKFAVLAAGEGDVLVRLISPSRPDYREKIWDQAAGGIIVEEAGGRVTDLDGKSPDFTQGRTLAANRGVLATNGRLHDAVLAALKAIGA
jgi:3'(2'), 5'-bisphosphate nucleotidase